MKTINLFFAMALLVGITACKNTMNNVLSETDKLALQAMETSYAAAVEANNNLAVYVDTSGITNDEICFSYDADFHQNDSIFESNHMMYSHSNSGDDHSSSSWSMGSGMNNDEDHDKHGNMMGNGTMMNFSDYCSQQNLELMDSLLQAHEQYHPIN